MLNSFTLNLIISKHLDITKCVQFVHVC